MIGRFLGWCADRLIRRALRTPYFHLLHDDGSLYMERYWLFRSRWLSARIHHLCTPDYDRHLHDHPWTFLSVVLRGGYVELRPADIEPQFYDDGIEPAVVGARKAGSVAIRFATDRHLIQHVEPDTWTLFITLSKVQWWGFHTPRGKVHWRDYESVHNNGPIEGAR